MCKHGDEVLLSVPIPAHLSHTGELRWDIKGVDACIAPIVKALNDAGIYTASCCCGHGKSDGIILLHDGRALVIPSPTVEPEPVEFSTHMSNDEWAAAVLEEIVRKSETGREE